MQKILLKTIRVLGENYVLLSVLVVCLKLLIIPFTSESFDTATYLYQVKRLYDFNFLALDNWNKSYFLLYIYKISYSAYITCLEVFQLTKDNLMLFHIFFKSSLVLSDFGIGAILYKLAEKINLSLKQKVFIVLLWLINPFVWYSAYMKGQYELIVVFVIILSIYLLLMKKHTFSLIALASAFAFKYVFIIFLPLYFLVIIGRDLKSYNFVNILRATIKNSIIFGTVFLLAYTANILPFIDFRSLTKTSTMLSMHYGSVLNFLGSSNSSINIGTPTVDGPIYKILYYLLYNTNPTMDTQLYSIWQNVFSIYIFGALLTFLFCRLVYLMIKQKQVPNNVQILYILLTILTVFYLTQSKIEAHWYMWSFPLVILLGVYHNKSLLKFSLALLLMITIAIFGSGPQKFHFANLNMEFEKYLPQWTLFNFSENIGIFLFSSYLIYLLYFLITLKRKSWNNGYLLYFSVAINAAVLFLLVLLYTNASALLLANRNPNTTPNISVSAARTWYYSTAIDSFSGRPYFPKVATKYISYLFDTFPDVFEDNFLLVLDKHTYQENIQSLPVGIGSKDENLYYFEFSEVKHLFETQNGLMYINLENATRATLMHSLDTGYAESYYFIKQKKNNAQYKKPYYLSKFKSTIYFNTAIFYVGFVCGVKFLVHFYYNLLIKSKSQYGK